jgi:hypothetical protein
MEMSRSPDATRDSIYSMPKTKPSCTAKAYVSTGLNHMGIIQRGLQWRKLAISNDELDGARYRNQVRYRLLYSAILDTLTTSINKRCET